VEDFGDCMDSVWWGGMWKYQKIFPIIKKEIQLEVGNSEE